MAKEFTLTHVINNVSTMRIGEFFHTESVEFYGVPWKMRYSRTGTHLEIFLNCDKPIGEEPWVIKTSRTLKLISVNGEIVNAKSERPFGWSEGLQGNSWGWSDFLSWDLMMRDYVVGDQIIIEADVKILEMSEIERPKMRLFDESTKKLSDLVVVVEGVKFYVSRLFLASQSSYFESLLLGNFKEAQEKEITLQDTNAKDFQIFLEVLHGESALCETSIKGVLGLADMYDSRTVRNQCELFLCHLSKSSVKIKLQLASVYKLDMVKKQSLKNMKTPADVRAAMDASKMDPSLLAELFEKAMSLFK